MPPSDLSTNHLSKEAQVLLEADTVSSARTLEIISYYIIAHDHVRFRLQQELRDIIADFSKAMPSLLILELFHT